MCTYVYPVSILAVIVAACMIQQRPVVSQCTRRHCGEDGDGDGDGDGDSDVRILAAMVYRLQDTMELQHQQLNVSTEQLHQQQRVSTERLQQQLRVSTEHLQHQLLASTEQLQQQLNDSTEQQQKQLTKLTETLAKQGELLKRLVPARNCYDLLRDGNNVSGVYEVYLAKAMKYVRVYCDMETDGGGWLVFQRRQDGSVDFNRDWADYKEGFGDVTGEFWLGNYHINDITSQARYSLRIDMEDFENESRYAVYTNFAVAPEGDKYKLVLGAYSGTAGDSLSGHAGNSFSTKDRDYDVSSGHCAQTYKGGWWYSSCHSSNLNGLYLGGPHASYADGIEWHKWHGYHYSLKKVEIKIRP